MCCSYMIDSFLLQKYKIHRIYLHFSNFIYIYLLKDSKLVTTQHRPSFLTKIFKNLTKIYISIF